MKFDKDEIIDEFSKLIISALTLISALAWNEAFRNFFRQYPSLQKNGPWIYAILVTIIVIIIVCSITEFKEKCKLMLNKNKKKEKKK